MYQYKVDLRKPINVHILQLISSTQSNKQTHVKKLAFNVKPSNKMMQPSTFPSCVCVL